MVQAAVCFYDPLTLSLTVVIFNSDLLSLCLPSNMTI